MRKLPTYLRGKRPQPKATLRTRLKDVLDPFLFTVEMERIDIAITDLAVRNAAINAPAGANTAGYVYKGKNFRAINGANAKLGPLHADFHELGALIAADAQALELDEKRLGNALVVLIPADVGIDDWQYIRDLLPDHLALQFEQTRHRDRYREPGWMCETPEGQRLKPAWDVFMQVTDRYIMKRMLG